MNVRFATVILWYFKRLVEKFALNQSLKCYFKCLKINILYLSDPKYLFIALSFRIRFAEVKHFFVIWWFYFNCKNNEILAIRWYFSLIYSYLLIIWFISHILLTKLGTFPELFHRFQRIIWDLVLSKWEKNWLFNSEVHWWEEFIFWGVGVPFVLSKRFGNSVIHIAEQWSQLLLSIHEDIFNPANLLFFLLSLYRVVNWTGKNGSLNCFSSLTEILAVWQSSHSLHWSQNFTSCV